jgi:hypothetical protein
MYEAREIAIERMQYERRNLRPSQGWQTHVIEFFAIGTAVLAEQEIATGKIEDRSWRWRSTISPFCGLANAEFPRKIRPCKELWL